MIIPTPEFHSMYAHDGIAFRAKTIEYIRRNFAEVLGPRVGLLDRENGLEILAEMYRLDEPGFEARKAA